VAGFGGIITAEPFAKLAAGKPAFSNNFVSGFAITAVAFGYAALYVQITEKLPKYLRERYGDIEALKKPLVRVHKFAGSGRGAECAAVMARPSKD
jgi:hypothetical protein